MNKIIKLTTTLVFLLTCYNKSFADNKDNKLTIVSDIYPVQQIANAIYGQKTFLISESYLSPHSYQLTPKKANLIKQADIFIWVGKPLMPQISKIVASRDKNTLTLLDINGLELLSGNGHDHNHEEHQHNNDHKNAAEHDEHGHEHHEENSDMHMGKSVEKTTGKNTEKHMHDDADEDEKYSKINEHIWLSTHNAKIIAKSIANNLITIDEINKDNYLANLKTFNEKIDKTKNDIQKLLSNTKNSSFYVFHDAYRYFENEFNLKEKGIIKISPNKDVHAKHLVELKFDIKKSIESNQTVCIFSEPQFNTKIANQLADDTAAKLGTLDPIGYQDSVDIGFENVLLNIAKSFNSCFSSN